MNNIQNNILNKIKKGDIDMKPKWHFMFKAGLLLSGVVTVSLLAVYLLSFIAFSMKQSGVAFAPGFGFRGFSFFIMSSPWLLIGVSTAFLVLLYFLVKQYSFSYRQPLLYSMIGVVLISLLGSWFLLQTPVHQRVGSFVERNEVPMLSPMYRGAIGERPEGLVVGVISEVTDKGFTINSERDGVVSVIFTNETRVKSGTIISVGEVVMVFGEHNRDEGSINAFGVRSDNKGRMGSFPKPKNQQGQMIRYMQERPRL